MLKESKSLSSVDGRAVGLLSKPIEHLALIEKSLAATDVAELCLELVHSKALNFGSEGKTFAAYKRVGGKKCMMQVLLRSMPYRLCHCSFHLQHVLASPVGFSSLLIEVWNVKEIDVVACFVSCSSWLFTVNVPALVVGMLVIRLQSFLRAASSCSLIHLNSAAILIFIVK